MATSVLANFRQVAAKRAIKIHPIVAGLIDPKALERLREAREHVADGLTENAEPAE